MSKKELDAHDVESYKTKGFFLPADVLSQEEVAFYRTKLESFEKETKQAIQGSHRSNSHLLFTWIDELVRNPVILDCVEAIIGSNILCWNTLWWIKEPQSSSFVSWHQDSRYWGLDTDDLVNVWLALSPATTDSGCMSVLPGSHKGEILPHTDKYEGNNLLTRGQEIDMPIDNELTVPMQLKPGQISLHNVRIAHGSGTNKTKDRRIGLSIQYIPPSTKQLAVEWDSATLCRGVDDFGHFELAPQPKVDFDKPAQEFHSRAATATREILFKGATKVRPLI